MSKTFRKGVNHAFKLILACVIVFSILGCSRAHIMIKDQHGEPVEDVHITAVSSSGINTYLGGSNATTRHTDEKGRASFPVGAMFRINKVKKEGYQFREDAQLEEQYGDSILGSSAKRFGRSNPLVIQGWKRGEQPDLTYVRGRVFFSDNIDHCTLELVQPDKKNKLSEPLTLRFDLETNYKPAEEDLRTPDRKFVANQWRAWFELSNAKLRGTDDLFLNWAPRKGYVKMLELGPSYGRETSRVFLRGDNGDFFGGALLMVRPDMGTKASLDDVNTEGMVFQFWFNFQGDQNIMRKPERTFWSHRGIRRDERKYCKEDPL